MECRSQAGLQLIRIDVGLDQQPIHCCVQVLSLGTGSSKIPPVYKGPLYWGFPTSWRLKEEEWGEGLWASPAITAALDGNAKAAHQAAASAFAVADLMPAYVRLQVSAHFLGSPLLGS